MNKHYICQYVLCLSFKNTSFSYIFLDFLSPQNGFPWFHWIKRLYSDVSLSEDDSDYFASSESDSGDEIAPSPRKESKVKFSKKKSEGLKTSRSLFVDEADSEDDIPNAQVRDAIRAKACEKDENGLI